MNFDEYRRYTQARILLGNTGAGLPTKALLNFAVHHANAVDAIHLPWAIKDAKTQLLNFGYQSQILKTAVRSREEYLLRPDLGKRLCPASKNLLGNYQNSHEKIVVVISNGLSSAAIHNHLGGFLDPFFNALKIFSFTAEIFLAENGRVALIDEVGEILRPTIGMVIIGERPGLSSPDSLAVYLTYQPQIGRVDAERNCVSNIRPPHGLSYDLASSKVIFLIKESLRRKLSGVHLKDDSSQHFLKK